MASAEEMDGCYHAVYNLSKETEQKIYTGQTGHFPVQSHKRLQYGIVLYQIKSITILIEPLRNKKVGRW